MPRTWTTGAGTTSAAARTAVAAVAGIVAGVVTAFFTLPQAAALIGWDVAALVFLGQVWLTIRNMDADSTRSHAARLDPSRSLADLLVVLAALAILTAVALALVQAGRSHGVTKAYLLTVGISSVALGWLVIQSVYTLRYAHLYYTTASGGIDFKDPEAPDYIDFAYLAFTIGMTFQVSDTDLAAKPVRRTALRHALTSYVFGAIIVALVINIVATLL